MSTSFLGPCRTALLRRTAGSSICSIPSPIASSSFSSSSAPLDESQPLAAPTPSPSASSSSSSPAARTSTRHILQQNKINFPKTNWSSPLHLDPAPPVKFSHLTPPLPDSTFATSIKEVAIGPSSSNATSLKHAERSLHLRLLFDGNATHHVGPEGTVRGVQFVNAEKARTILAAASENAADESLAVTSKRQRQQAYLEREGGDYTRFLPEPPQKGSAQAEWQRTAAHALSCNASITPEARQSLTRQVGDLLQGKPFLGNQGSLAKVGAVKEAPAPVPEAAVAPAKKKGRK